MTCEKDAEHRKHQRLRHRHNCVAVDYRCACYGERTSVRTNVANVVQYPRGCLLCGDGAVRILVIVAPSPLHPHPTSPSLVFNQNPASEKIRDPFAVREREKGGELPQQVAVQ